MNKIQNAYTTQFLTKYTTGLNINFSSHLKINKKVPGVGAKLTVEVPSFLKRNHKATLFLGIKLKDGKSISQSINHRNTFISFYVYVSHCGILLLVFS